ncbi:MAG: HAD family phosphatase [Oscillospiraceae bacterium]|nr:HAD family phosphatase [Oscillospiraceae bacterium]
MCRLIVLDVDGTLLNSEGMVSPENILAIQEARAKGVRVVLGTGRSAPEAAYFTALTGCDSRAVCLGGAAIADMKTMGHLERWDMAPDTGVEALKIVQSAPLARMIFAGEVNLMDPDSNHYFEANYPFDCFHNHKIVTEDVISYLSEHRLPITKFYSVGAPEQFPPLLERLRAMPDLDLTSSSSDNFEVLSKGVNKGRALAVLARMWDIPIEETAAIGDSGNDLAMLEAAGYPVAMGNAGREIKEAARYVTDTNDRDGVAKAIRHLIG